MSGDLQTAVVCLSYLPSRCSLTPSGGPLVDEQEEEKEEAEEEEVEVEVVVVMVMVKWWKKWWRWRWWKIQRGKGSCRCRICSLSKVKVLSRKYRPSCVRSGRYVGGRVGNSSRLASSCSNQHNSSQMPCVVWPAVPRFGRRGQDGAAKRTAGPSST